MADAVVGDDCYGEDPSVNALQEAFADRVGKEASLYVPSGTMANQLALVVLSAPGTAVVAGARQHVVRYERGGAARNASVQFHPVDDEDGTFTAGDVTSLIEAARYHVVRPSLVCVENSHMASGGRVWELGCLETVARAAGELPLHIDGARLFNAEAATGTPAASYAGSATTVQCCMSKGLGAPVGSLLAGPKDVIDAAREERARLGGAMRQAGVIAAAALVALTEMTARLVEDHSRARRLAEAVVQRWGEAICNLGSVMTNIVLFEHPDPLSLVAHMESQGVRVGMVGPGVVRMVTHHDVDDEGVKRAIETIRTTP
jgi:threonine aldolase